MLYGRPAASAGPGCCSNLAIVHHERSWKPHRLPAPLKMSWSQRRGSGFRLPRNRVRAPPPPVHVAARRLRVIPRRRTRPRCWRARLRKARRRTGPAASSASIELHQALVMGGHVAHLHLAGGQLVGAEHGDHARTHLVGQLELAFQAAVLVIHLGGHARIAACLHQAERLGAHGIVDAGHEHVAMLGARKFHDRPPAGPARSARSPARSRSPAWDGRPPPRPACRSARRRRWRSGLPMPLIDLHLEHGAGVVVQAAHQRGVLHRRTTPGAVQTEP